MENRRKDYRHVFEPERRLSVEVESMVSHAKLQAGIVDLSTGGMRIRLSKTDVPPAVEEPLVARADLPLPGGSLKVRATVVYSLSSSHDLHCGLRFLPSDPAESNLAQERMIWRFLTEEQRQVLRKRRKEKVR